MTVPGLARDCCFPAAAPTLSFDTARRLATAAIRPIGEAQHVPLAAAAGRVLAAPVSAPHALPPFDQAAMDGYALCLAGRPDLTGPLPLAGRTGAGDPPGMLVPGTAHRVMTGAALPRGADTVVMQEQATCRDGLVRMAGPLAPGAHVRRQGEDVGRDEIVLAAGRVIGWPEIMLLAGLGIDRVPVARPVRIAVLATGAELRSPGLDLAPGTIHDANGPMLAALLAGPETEVSSFTVGDDRAAITAMLARLAVSADLIVTTAGMSVGPEDHMRGALREAGGRLDVVKVAMKPGKPLALGGIGQTGFVGLPGNPQAAAFGALAFVRPMVDALLGLAPAEPETASLGFFHAGRDGRTELAPVRLTAQRGRWIAEPCGPAGSHRLMPMVLADAVAILPDRAALPGTIVETLSFGHRRRGAARGDSPTT